MLSPSERQKQTEELMVQHDEALDPASSWPSSRDRLESSSEEAMLRHDSHGNAKPRGRLGSGMAWIAVGSDPGKNPFRQKQQRRLSTELSWDASLHESEGGAVSRRHSVY